MTPSPRLSALAALAITGLALTGATTAAAATAAPRVNAVADGGAGTAHARTARTPAGGTRLWAVRGPQGSFGSVTAASPNGSAVFVAEELDVGGISSGLHNFEVVAYKPATGTVIWKAVFNPGTSGPNATSGDYLKGIAVSPDGSTVFVTGNTPARHTTYITIAFNAATGTRLWVDRGKIEGAAYAIGMSPDGSAVFVTGQTATVAYSAATGATLWTQGTGTITATALAVSPHGSGVFVTGQAAGGVGPATMALNAATGATLWTRDPGIHGATTVTSIAASPDGSAVFVTGGGNGDYVTAAYNATSGATLWTHSSSVVTNALAVSPRGSKLYVTGYVTMGLKASYVTVAYNAATGASLWQARYGDGGAYAIAVSPDGSTVFVTGTTRNANHTLSGVGTVAYNAATGSKLWTAVDLTNYVGFGYSVAVGPDGTTVFVTGYLWPTGPTVPPHMVTLAYSS